MIIDTKEILNLIGLRFTNEGESIIKVAPIRDKISIALIKGRLSTKRLSKNLGLEPRTVRKNLCILEKEGIVKRILGNKINNFVRETDFWELRDKKNVLMSVPKEKIYVSYSTIHTNGGSRIHYFIFPKKVFLTEEFLSALGFFQAEGSKTRQRTIEAVNGEPLLINLFLNFLRYFNVGSEDVAFRVHFNRKILRELKTNKQDLERRAVGFWSRKVDNLSEEKVKFVYSGAKKGALRKNVLDKGSLSLSYHSRLFNLFFFRLLTRCKSKLKSRPEIVSFLRGFFAGEAYVGNHDREIQIAINTPLEMVFIRGLLERINIRSSLSKRTSTSPPRLLICSLGSFLLLHSYDIFKFHPEKKKNLVKKILNYKSLDEGLRKKLQRELRF